MTGQREEPPETSAFCLEVQFPCTPSSECGGAGFSPTRTLSLPPAFLFSGPEPGATSKCRLVFLRAPGSHSSDCLLPQPCLVLPALGRAGCCDPHHCIPNPSLRLIIFFVQHIPHCCHAHVLFCRHWALGGGEWEWGDGEVGVEGVHTCREPTSSAHVCRAHSQNSRGLSSYAWLPKPVAAEGKMALSPPTRPIWVLDVGKRPFS